MPGKQTQEDSGSFLLHEVPRTGKLLGSGAAFTGQAQLFLEMVNTVTVVTHKNVPCLTATKL